MRFCGYISFEMRFLGNPALFCGAKCDKRCDHRLQRPRFAAFYCVLLSKYRLAWSWMGSVRDTSPRFVRGAALLGGKRCIGDDFDRRLCPG